MTESIFISVIFSNLSPLFAYIGPGMGGGVIAAIFGIIAAFFLGLWGILYYPIKRAFKNQFSNVDITKCKKYRFDYSIPRKCESKKPAKQVICNNKNKNNQKQN